ncbi:hypothetical protein [Angustibacter luteus]|uniref:Secreted protein n=1 Tax=Angustibacter luteus TaxID=658456 RepID=A0ABW1JJ15_9ACTN
MATTFAAATSVAGPADGVDVEDVEDVEVEVLDVEPLAVVALGEPAEGVAVAPPSAEEQAASSSAAPRATGAAERMDQSCACAVVALV